MANAENKEKDINYAGLGLILGTAIGFGFGFIVLDKIWLAPFGTGLGIVFGAMINNTKENERKKEKD